MFSRNYLIVAFVFFLSTVFWPAALSAGSANFISVAAGCDHTILLRCDGTVWSWGNNDKGQLGFDPSLISQSHAPLKVEGLVGIKAVAAGNKFSLALKEDGTVWAWGYNERGQLGNGTFSNSFLPVQVVVDPEEGDYLDAMTAIDAGYRHALALKEDGTVWSWGASNWGQLGVGSTSTSSKAVQVKGPEGEGFLKNIEKISAGFNHNLALSSDGTVWAWGRNSTGQLGDGSCEQQNIPVQVVGEISDRLENVEHISAGEQHSLAVAGGVVFSWGYNSSGQLGNYSLSDSNRPVRAAVTDIAMAAAGGDHSVAVDKEGRVWSWGDNSSGQLGNGGSGTRRTYPDKTLGTDGDSTLEGITKVFAGQSYTMALGGDSRLLAWGNNSYGQLGLGAAGDKSIPTLPLIAVPPRVDKTEPLQGAQEVEPRTTVVITFAEGIAAGPAFNKIALLDAEGEEVEVLALLNGSSLMLEPGGKLPLGTTLTVVLPAQSLEGEHGNFLDPFSFSFTTRKASSNALLGSLVIKEGEKEIGFAFQPHTLFYTLEVEEQPEWLAVIPSAQDSAALIRVNGSPVLSGDIFWVKLAAGEETQVRVIVTAEDGEAELTYHLSILRKPGPKPEPDPGPGPEENESKPDIPPKGLRKPGRRGSSPVKRTVPAPDSLPQKAELDLRLSKNMLAKIIINEKKGPALALLNLLLQAWVLPFFC